VLVLATALAVLYMLKMLCCERTLIGELTALLQLMVTPSAVGMVEILLQLLSGGWRWRCNLLLAREVVGLDTS
jgi:hypothetical protein